METNGNFQSKSLTDKELDALFVSASWLCDFPYTPLTWLLLSRQMDLLNSTVKCKQSTDISHNTPIRWSSLLAGKPTSKN